MTMCLKATGIRHHEHLLSAKEKFMALITGANIVSNLLPALSLKVFGITVISGFQVDGMAERAHKSGSG